MKKILNGDRIALGTCYYPEHWPKEMWKNDLERMSSVGIEVVRIAEFAWSKFERTEGNFTFDFFDEFLDLAEAKNMSVIFCTPTATPPAWLTNKYPEVLNVNINGIAYAHGERRQYNYNSLKYIELSAIIVREIANHYAKRNCIIGWQIDNEINCECDVFYSESDTLAFREFLKEKYKTLDTLNEAWGTVFWNQTYTDWEEIYVPRPTYQDSVNPHLELDYKRFISSSARKYVKMQSDILKEFIKPNDFITTNGLFGNLDSHSMTRESLDFFTYDSYPNFAYCIDSYNADDKLKDRHWSENLSIVRSISNTFGIMEQQSGANGWNTRMEAPMPRPDQIKLWTMQSIAHGADYVSFFRWRTCTFGTEIYWHGILDYSNRDNRRLQEISDIHDMLVSMECIAGGRYEADVAIIADYDNIWDSEVDRWHGRVAKSSQKAIYEASQLTHTPVDYVYLSDESTLNDINSYKVIFYPHISIVTSKRMEILKEYVKQGGCLIIGCRSGYKDINGKCVMDKLPGLLTELTGTDVHEYTFIAPDEENVTIDWNGRRLHASIFTDLLDVFGSGEVCATYTSNYYKGTPAIICNKLEKGNVYYYGSVFDRDAATVFFENLNVCNPYSHIVDLPECCEVAVRNNDGNRYMFILNYSDDLTTVEFKTGVRNIITDEIVQGKVNLSKYGVLLVEL